MKKFSAIILALSMLLVTAGCNTTAPVPSSSTPSSSVPDASSSQPASPAPADGDIWRSYDAEGKVIREGRDATGANGIVSSGRYEASKVGVDILEKGGNAVDAAVATGFAIGVVEPEFTGLGGGGFMTLRIAETGETLFIDFREIAPAKATPEMWVLDEKGKVVNNENMIGGKAVGVPGEVAGLTYALEKYGTMSLKEILEPVIALAENGYEVTPTLNGDTTNAFDRFAKFPETAKIYLDENGLPPPIGATIKNPDLANTLRKIADGGKDAFYKGEIAQAMVDAVQEAGGVLTMEDLANYEVEVRTPISGTYRGYEIISSPPPSSGGTHIVQILNMMENYDVAAMGLNSPEHLHLLSETFKLAYADRAKYMGDTDFVEVPLEGIASKEYAKELVKQIDMKTSKEYTAGDPWQYEHQDTTHYSVADKAGNIVSVTKTINGIFGSLVTAKDTGIIMNNEMGDFDVGAGKANSIEPGKKPLSSMSPTIVLKDGKPFLVLGSPGGTRIITTVVQVISNVIDFNMDLQDAINAPRIFDNTGNNISYENRIEKATIDALVAMGHKVSEDNDWSRSFGSVQAAQYMDDGTMRGGADPRRDGKAIGY